MPVTITITALPPAPERGVDTQDTFVNKAEALFSAIENKLQPEINSVITQINTVEANTIAKSNIATTKAGEASDSADIATTAANLIVSALAQYGVTADDLVLVYEPADPTILKEADIGDKVQAYNEDILTADDIGTTVQRYSLHTVKNDENNLYTKPQKGEIYNIGSSVTSIPVNLLAKNNFIVEGYGTLTFENVSSTAGQSGNIILNLTGTLSIGANILYDADLLNITSTQGVYWLSYICDGSRVYLSTGGKMS
jgi:hypothetical protein